MFSFAWIFETFPHQGIWCNPFVPLSFLRLKQLFQFAVVLVEMRTFFQAWKYWNSILFYATGTPICHKGLNIEPFFDIDKDCIIILIIWTICVFKNLFVWLKFRPFLGGNSELKKYKHVFNLKITVAFLQIFRRIIQFWTVIWPNWPIARTSFAVNGFMVTLPLWMRFQNLQKHQKFTLKSKSEAISYIH